MCESYTYKKILASLLLSASLSVNATIVTGGLSYDDTGTHLITGTNGLTYVGWTDIASYNYMETLVATAVGGIYQEFHIANQVEAGEFFSLATGLAAPTAYGEVKGETPIDLASFGFHNHSYGPSAGVWFLIDLNRGRNEGRKEVGILGISSYSLLPFIWTNANAYDIAHTDRHSASGSVSQNLRSWLLVSGPVPTSHPIPAPSTPLILGIGLLGLRFARKKKIVSCLSVSRDVFFMPN